ncbi:MAG TPA: ABC transporter permease [Gemmatimonadaceae bacterium]|nr:ABC transporter permease [Gemmatimonadaceae bacterium]
MRRFFMKLARRVRALVHGDTLDAELSDEIRLHIELETEDLMQTRGLSRDEARRQAMVGFGGVERYREAQRDARGVRWIEQVAQDVKYAVRSLRKSPGFVVTSVLTIALGIGVTTTVYSVVNRLILHPLPFAHEDRIVILAWQVPGRDVSDWITSNDVANWARDAASFQTISLLDPYAGGLVTEPARSLFASGTGVSPTLFQSLGVQPVLGRSFVNADTARGAPRVIMLGEGFWRREFGARSDVVGQAIKVKDTTYTVIGVAPEQLIALRDYQEVDLWVPITSARLAKLGSTMQGIQGVGLLKSGVSVTRAEQELTLLMRRLLAERGPVKLADAPSAVLVRPSMLLDSSFTEGLWALFWATLLVLLIACANVANLQLVRASRRAQETAIRAALGASRGRLLRQLMVESLALAIVGGACGILVAWAGLQVIVNSHPDIMGHLATVQLDRRVLAFGIGMILFTSLIYGAVPALHTTRSRLAGALRRVSQAGRGSPGGRRLQSGIVVVEVAVACVLLIGAGLPTHSFLKMLAIDPGYAPAGMLEFSVWPTARYPDSTSEAGYWNSVLTRVRALPGVEAAVPASGSMLQSNLQTVGGNVEAEDGPMGGKPQLLTIASRNVPGDYFRVLGIRMLAGQTFSAEDERSEPNVEIIDKSLAERLWPGQPAVGKRFRWGNAPSFGPWITVKGVVSDVGLVGLRGVSPLQAYKPHRADDVGRMSGFFVRVSPNTNEQVALATVKSVIHSVDPLVPIPSANTESEIVDGALAIPRFATALVTAFAALALLLAAIGLYGTIAYGVSQRTREIGVRIALGAHTGDVSKLITGSGLRLALGGMAIGLVGALAGARLLAGLLYGISPTDPAVFVAIPVGLLVVAGAASYLPARRAARVDPVIALRAE